MDDPPGDELRLHAVVASAAAVVHALCGEELDADVVAVVQCSRKGHHGVAVEGPVAERDQVLVTAAVVPEQGKLTQGARLAGVQQRLEGVEDVLVVLLGVVLDGRVKEGRGRQLLLVAGHDQRICPVYAVDGVGWADL
ncbi:hypothetical protein ACWDA7_45080 [Streptomyces sp. NPDC001156]